MPLEKPIFILGIGRSGTTVFHEMLAQHPHAVWLSRLCDAYPFEPLRNRRLMQAVDYPVIGRYLCQRFKPLECFSFWERHCTGFSRACRDLVAADVTEIAKERIRNVLGRMHTTKRHRLVAKITGWPRLGYLQHIFGDAKFIHLVRDGRAVVNSRLQQSWWIGWEGPYHWLRGPLTPVQMALWEKYERSFVALAAVELAILQTAFEKARCRATNGSLLQIRYEDLCANPLESFRVVAEFCGLAWSDQFGARLRQYSLKSGNHKWQQDLTNAQQEILSEVLTDYQTCYGYR
jgi:hypothetical protein